MEVRGYGETHEKHEALQLQKEKKIIVLGQWFLIF